MKPTAQQLDGLIDLLVAAVLRELESEKKAAADPGRHKQRPGDDDEQFTPDYCPRK